jgi:hypothetical protein
MELSNVASGIAAGAAVSGTLDVTVLSAVNNLAAVQSAIMFASIGLGTGVDTFA